jgi:DNA repair photolyase
MQDIVDRLLTRPSLQQAQMAGAAVRGAYHREPKETLTSLASWSAHPDTHVRIASGIAYGVIGQRNRDALSEILPYVERLANDSDDNVREHGAEAALEQLWLAHTDAMWVTIEDWIGDKNDRIRQVVVATIARITTSGKIGRPSLLKRFMERGLGIFDQLTPGASPLVVQSLAQAVDAMGCLAPDVVTPHVLQWAEQEDAKVLALVVAIAKTPYGPLCAGLDLKAVQTRVRKFRQDSELGAATSVSRGDGKVEYVQIVTSEFLIRQKSDHMPWAWIADPYRGCQLRCEFCNARTTSEWSEDGTAGFVRRVTSVQNAATLLATELGQEHMEPRSENAICLGVTSDPYQPSEERLTVTRDILKACLAAEHPVIIQTRQQLVLRDLDIIELLAMGDLVNVYISMQSSVDGIRSKVEPGSSSTAERLRTMRMLSSKGVPVGLLLSPIMPEVTDDEALLDETLRCAADAGASWVTSEVLNLRGSARAKMRRFLGDFAPALLPRYAEIYTGGDRIGAPDPSIVQKLTEELIPSLAEKHGLTDTSRMLTSGREASACLVRL